VLSGTYPIDVSRNSRRWWLQRITAAAVGACVSIIICPITAVASGPTTSSLVSNGRQPVEVTWRATGAPLPADTSTSTVSCGAVGRCVAVGARGLLDTLSDGTWTTTEAPLPAFANSTSGQRVVLLSSVSCASAGNCVAVGSYQDRSGSRGLVETLSGGTWTATNAPAPVAASDPSVSCGAVGSCVAVGYPNGIVETLEGRNWITTETPLPKGTNNNGAQSVVLSSVSCAARSCAVSGYYKGNSQRALLETLSAGKWTATEAPLPPDTNILSGGFLDALSCAAAARCTAVGGYYSTNVYPPGGGSQLQPLVDVLSGGKWSVTKLPLPTDIDNISASTFLESVSCAADGSCVAIGQWFLEAWLGGTWTAINAPLPAGTASSPTENMVLSSVSCASGGMCVAAGSYNGGGLLETSYPRLQPRRAERRGN
jgi:hypothetical protein